MVARYLLVLLILLGSSIDAEAQTDIITKQNQKSFKTDLTVTCKASEWGGNLVPFAISIPANDHRLKRLFRADYILGAKGKPYPAKVTVPLEITANPDSSKTIFVRLDPSTVGDSFIQFTCHWENPLLSSLDGVLLRLGSYWVLKE